jgi:hypothetical protein
MCQFQFNSRKTLNCNVPVPVQLKKQFEFNVSNVLVPVLRKKNFEL